MSSTMSVFTTAVRAILTKVSSDPLLLKKSPASMVAFLQKQGNLDSQGTGNKVTDQEASFADIAANHGFTFHPKGASNPTNGLYYLYQLQGSQQEGDFGLREYDGGKIKSEIIIDLKHTKGKVFYLNDGWFQKNVVYIISWNTGTPKKPLYRTHIALGQDIPSAEEQSFMESLITFKKEKNMATNTVGSLRPYIRFANQYSCERFTDVVAAEHLGTALSFVHTKSSTVPSSPPLAASSVPQQKQKRRVRIVGLEPPKAEQDTASEQAQLHE